MPNVITVAKSKHSIYYRMGNKGIGLEGIEGRFEIGVVVDDTWVPRYADITTREVILHDWTEYHMLVPHDIHPAQCIALVQHLMKNTVAVTALYTASDECPLRKIETTYYNIHEE